MKTGRVRRLTTSDTDEILRIVELEELDTVALTRELAAGDDYLWMGLDSPAGGLGAIHRSMRWGDHLLLKGVFVDEPLRGSGAALELAFALRDAARNGGYAGLAAWVEPHKPEAGLAHMLRLRATGPMIHRFDVPVLGDGLAVATPAHSTGRLAMDLPDSVRPAPLVGDLLSGDSLTAVCWVLDRHRLVLSGFPPHSVSDLHLVISAAGPLARSQGASFVEFPIPAADMTAAFTLAALKARRLSRTPVRLGRLDFDTGRRATDRQARREAAHDAA
ncbi:hypothetical protein ACIO6T_19595 [Streptomyces sp. NPDC087532]|uniref:hypothetical protein n=1 Tax=unclassified Streptomyces TaxID=2593676 RepID=UPI00331F9DF1